MNREEFITTDEAIDMVPPGVKVDRFHFYRQRKAGKLNSFRFGKRVYLLREEVEKYINSRFKAKTA
ncbi:MAG: helix-turn-helix domain-containing protein [Phaeodactylibacter xiamenensis]|uniref:Helix-turn-helix domain-containing protein n=1 Tax=Phaeodactylibacter xiamenensis TaxID=1524460 RepID=A0A098S2C0_9BACT|nr:helix-turn-helix domain-containing protein [Phaeodactylibacter xiamenensis]KGE85928.1 hypothetical protein IX84_25320 [Phaeodactylibacter xiamenensis]MCR9051278.1 helix-turn-helix domain-containing protein [bacterium]